MAIRKLTEDVFLVTLLEDKSIAVDIKNICKIAEKDKDCDVIIDFTLVDVITSTDINNLFTLRELLQENGRHLILCNLFCWTKGIFNVLGLNDVFKFSADKYEALEFLQKCTKS